MHCTHTLSDYNNARHIEITLPSRQMSWATVVILLLRTRLSSYMCLDGVTGPTRAHTCGNERLLVSSIRFAERKSMLTLLFHYLSNIEWLDVQRWRKGQEVLEQ